MVICETDVQKEARLSEHQENVRATDRDMMAHGDGEHQLKTLVNNRQIPQPDQNSGVKLQNLDDVLSGFKLGPFHWRMLVLVGGGYFAACSEMMVFVFLSSPLKKEWGLGEHDFSWLPFSTGIAGVFGGYIAGTVSDKFGRRVPFLVGIMIIGVSGLASAFAPNFPLFIAFRCFVTIGIGTFESVGFVLLLEFLPRQQRGPILVTVTLCGALGAVLAGGFAWLILPSQGWRWFVAACAGPAFLLLCYQPFVFFETPRFLLSSGRKQEAVDLLKRMASVNKSELPNLGEISGVLCIRLSQPQNRMRPGSNLLSQA